MRPSGCGAGTSVPAVMHDDGLSRRQAACDGAESERCCDDPGSRSPWNAGLQRIRCDVARNRRDLAGAGRRISSAEVVANRRRAVRAGVQHSRAGRCGSVAARRLARVHAAETGAAARLSVDCRTRGGRGHCSARAHAVGRLAGCRVAILGAAQPVPERPMVLPVQRHAPPRDRRRTNVRAQAHRVRPRGSRGQRGHGSPASHAGFRRECRFDRSPRCVLAARVRSGGL